MRQRLQAALRLRFRLCMLVWPCALTQKRINYRPQLHARHA